MPKTYYEILGVSNTATEAQIRAAYRKVVREFHPDLNPGQKKSQRRTRELNIAIEVLTNPQRRKAYDERLARLKKGTAGAVNDTGFPEQPPKETAPVDIDVGSKNRKSNRTSNRQKPWLAKTLFLLASMISAGLSAVCVAVMVLWIFFRLDPTGLISEYRPNHPLQHYADLPSGELITSANQQLSSLSEPSMNPSEATLLIPASPPFPAVRQSNTTPTESSRLNAAASLPLVGSQPSKSQPNEDLSELIPLPVDSHPPIVAEQNTIPTDNIPIGDKESKVSKAAALIEHRPAFWNSLQEHLVQYDVIFQKQAGEDRDNEMAEWKTQFGKHFHGENERFRFAINDYEVVTKKRCKLKLGKFVDMGVGQMLNTAGANIETLPVTFVRASQSKASKLLRHFSSLKVRGSVRVFENTEFSKFAEGSGLIPVFRLRYKNLDWMFALAHFKQDLEIHENARDKLYVLEFNGTGGVQFPRLRFNRAEPWTIDVAFTPARVEDCSVFANVHNAGIGINFVHGKPVFAIRERGHYNRITADVQCPPHTLVQVSVVVSETGIKMFVDGKLQSQQMKIPAGFRPSTKTFYLGANPSSKNNPSWCFSGTVNALRISNCRRYEEDFVPVHDWQTDEQTVLLADFENVGGNVLRDRTKNNHEGVLKNVTLGIVEK